MNIEKYLTPRVTGGTKGAIEIASAIVLGGV